MTSAKCALHTVDREPKKLAPFETNGKTLDLRAVPLGSIPGCVYFSGHV